MRKIFRYILITIAVVVTASCSNEMDEPMQSAHSGSLQFVVGDFPAFGKNEQTRAIGTQDAGKTAWENGDEIIIILGRQALAITYNGTSWSTTEGFSYLENVTPEVIYAPCYEVTKNGEMQLRSGMQLGMTEYLRGEYQIANGTMTITFNNAVRNYSRLRMAGLANQTMTVTPTDFTPAGLSEKIASTSYSLTVDAKGNAYLYGTFAKDATVNVKQGTVTLTEYTFSEEKGHTNGTESGKSYALDARPIIDGTLNGKVTADKEDVDALLEQFKKYVDNGITTIVVPGTEHPTYTSNSITKPAYAYALNYLLTSQYVGKIDLILPDATEIKDETFDKAHALNSITLPKVTTIGGNAFSMCYYLQTITFGSVVTEINVNNVFKDVGDMVGNCNLVLNFGQTSSSYTPNYDRWCDKSWKSITLTHTGECSKCKALQ